MYIVDSFLKEFENLQDEYNKEKNLDKFKTCLYSVVSKYSKYVEISIFLTDIGEKYIAKGDYKAEIWVIKAVYERFNEMADEITVYLRVTDYYIENGDVEFGTEFLRKLSTETVDNYEEAISFRALTDIWKSISI